MHKRHRTEVELASPTSPAKARGDKNKKNELQAQLKLLNEQLAVKGQVRPSKIGERLKQKKQLEITLFEQPELPERFERDEETIAIFRSFDLEERERKARLRKLLRQNEEARWDISSAARPTQCRQQRYKTVVTEYQDIGDVDR